MGSQSSLSQHTQGNHTPLSDKTCVIELENLLICILIFVMYFNLIVTELLPLDFVITKSIDLEPASKLSFSTNFNFKQYPL